jgi:hypothetical protein
MAEINDERRRTAQAAPEHACCEGAPKGGKVKDNPEEFMRWLDKFAEAAKDFDDEDASKDTPLE